MTTFFIPGRIPSKKNRYRFNGITKKFFKDKVTEDWETSTFYLLKKQMENSSNNCFEFPLKNIYEIFIRYNFPDNRKKDLTNATESVMDILIHAGIIKDDSWQHVQKLVLVGQKDDFMCAGCEVIISCN